MTGEDAYFMLYWLGVFGLILLVAGVLDKMSRPKGRR